MERIVAAVLAVASVIAAFVLGRKSRSSHDDRERDIRGALDDIRETTEERGNAESRISSASTEIKNIGEEPGDAVPVYHTLAVLLSEHPELLEELNKTIAELEVKK